MKRPDVEPIEMTKATVIDREIQALLDGRPAVLDNALAVELSSLRDHVEASFPLPVIAEETRDAHLALMMRTFVAPAPIAPMAPKASLGNRAKAALSRRVAAATLAFSAAFGGAAYAGVLPAPIQDAASEAASMIGLEIPSSDKDESRTEDPSEGSTLEPKDELLVPDEQEDEKEQQGPAGADGSDGEDKDVGDRRGDADDRRGDDRDGAGDREDDGNDGPDDREVDDEDGADDAEDDSDDARDASEDERDDDRDEAEDREDDADDEREEANENEDDAVDDSGDDAEDVGDDDRDEAEDREDEARDSAEETTEDTLDEAESSAEDAEDD